MKNVAFLLIFALLISPTVKATLSASIAHGFIAQFPGKAQVIAVHNSLGPYAIYGSFDEKNGILYQLSAQKIEAFEKSEKLSEGFRREFIKSSFESYSKEQAADDVNQKWMQTASWTTLEFSCTHSGFLAPGIKSYKKGYFFVYRNTSFILTVHGFRDDKALAEAAIRFFSSFAFADENTIKSAVEAGAIRLAEPVKSNGELSPLSERKKRPIKI